LPENVIVLRFEQVFQNIRQRKRDLSASEVIRYFKEEAENRLLAQELEKAVNPKDSSTPLI